MLGLTVPCQQASSTLEQLPQRCQDAGSSVVKVTTAASSSTGAFFSIAGRQRLSQLDVNDSFQARNGHSSVTVKRCVYLFGGQAENGTLLNDLWMLDEEKKWHEVCVGTEKPAARYFHRLVVNDRTDSIWMFGGVGEGRQFFNDVWIFETIGRKWTKVETSGVAPPTRALASCVMSETSLVIYGGLDKDVGSLLDQHGGVWVLNTDTLHWTLYETPQNAAERSNPFVLNCPENRYAHHCTVWEHGLYVAGGYSAMTGQETSKLEDVWQFCLIQKVWQPLSVKLNTKKLRWTKPFNMHRCCSIRDGDTWIFVGSNGWLPTFHFPSRTWNSIELDGVLPDLCRHAVSQIPPEPMPALHPLCSTMRNGSTLVITGGQVTQKSCGMTFLISPLPVRGFVASDESALCSTSNSYLGPNLLVVPSAGDSTVDTMSNCSEQLSHERELSEVSDVMNDLIDVVAGLTHDRDELLAKNAELQQVVDKWKCSICYENDIGAMFLPCKHMQLCIVCSTKIVIERDMQCPICRVSVERIVHPFLPS